MESDPGGSSEQVSNWWWSVGPSLDSSCSTLSTMPWSAQESILFSTMLSEDISHVSRRILLYCLILVYWAIAQLDNGGYQKALTALDQIGHCLCLKGK